MERDGTPNSSTGTPDAPPVARLRLQRWPALMYAVVAVLLVVVLVISVGSWIGQGRFVFAGIAVVVGLAVVAFLGLLVASILAPDLTVTETGVAGRVGWRNIVDLDWTAVAVDAPEDSPPGRFRVDLGGEPVIVDQRSWLGFADFVLVVASTPAAARRLTPAARDEVLRLLTVAEASAEEEPEVAD